MDAKEDSEMDRAPQGVMVLSERRRMEEGPGGRREDDDDGDDDGCCWPRFLRLAWTAGEERGGAAAKGERRRTDCLRKERGALCRVSISRVTRAGPRTQRSKGQIHPPLTQFYGEKVAFYSERYLITHLV